MSNQAKSSSIKRATGGGTVFVKAHTRNGVSVKAYTKGVSTSGNGHRFKIRSVENVNLRSVLKNSKHPILKKGTFTDIRKALAGVKKNFDPSRGFQTQVMTDYKESKNGKIGKGKSLSYIANNKTWNKK